MRTANQKIIDAADSPVSDATVKLQIGSLVLGPESIQTATVSASTGEGGSFSVGSTEAASLSFTVLTSALPFAWTTQDIRAWFGYRVNDDSLVYDETLVLSDTTMSGDVIEVDSIELPGATAGDVFEYIGDETVKVLYSSYSPITTDGQAEVQEGGWVEVETLYLQRYEYVPMGLYATNDELVTINGTFTNVTAYDPFYWMSEQWTGSWSSAISGGKLSTLSAMSLICRAYGIKADLSHLPDVRLAAFRPKGTVRECIGQLAGASFVNARFSKDGILEFIRPRQTGKVFGLGDFAVGSLSTSSAESVKVDNVSASFSLNTSGGSEEYETHYPKSYTGNTVSYEADLFGEIGEDRTKLNNAIADINAIGANAKAFRQIPVSVKGFSIGLFGGLYMDLMDGFKAKDINGRTHNLLVLSGSWTYDGGISVSLSAEARSESTTVGSTASAATVAAGLNDQKTAFGQLNALVTETLNGDNDTFNDIIAGKVAENSNFVNVLSESETLREKLDEVYATDQELTGAIETEDAAIKQYVGEQGFLTEHQSLAGYATESWVTGKNYLTQHQDITGKADLASPAFTGVPTVPTAAAATSTGQIASTEFVMTAIAVIAGSISQIQALTADEMSALWAEGLS